MTIKMWRGARLLLYLTESGLFYATLQVSASHPRSQELTSESTPQIVRLAFAVGLMPSTPVFGTLYQGAYIFLSGSNTVAASRLLFVLLLMF